MSKQDTHFINVFSMVIGLLVAVAIALFALARIVASQTQDKDVLEDASYVRNVEQRVSPFAKEAIAGQDNTALAIKPDAGSAQAAGAGSVCSARSARAQRSSAPPSAQRRRTRSSRASARAVSCAGPGRTRDDQAGYDAAAVRSSRKQV